MGTVGKITRRFGISLLCLVGAHYAFDAIEPLVDTYLHRASPRQRLLPTYTYTLPDVEIPPPPPEVRCAYR